MASGGLNILPGYIQTAFVYKDIWHVLADTPCFMKKQGYCAAVQTGLAAQLHRC
jgi:hypothetical protein